MIPFGNHTVTLYHRESTGYARYLFNGCSWRSVNERAISDGSTIITERTTCRIPPHYICPATGDLLILGAVDKPIANEIELVRYMESLRKQGFRAFRAQSCADYRDAPLPHYAVLGA